jgi:uncharacterized protein
VKGALPDINVLLALAWPNHQHHALAHQWFRKHAQGGWATCAFTEVGFIRLSSNPAFTPAAVSPAEAADLLERFVAHKAHVFWNSPRARPRSIFERSLGHQQVNDAYLVEVARANKGRVATLDTKLDVHADTSDRVMLISSAG